MKSKTKYSAAWLAERRALRAEIEKTKDEMDVVQNHFEQVIDPTLIDCYIYELNAVQLRYQFLLRRFKSQEKIHTTSV